MVSSSRVRRSNVRADVTGIGCGIVDRWMLVVMCDAAGRLLNQVLRNEDVENNQNEARDEEEERELCPVIEASPVFGVIGAAGRLCGVRLDSVFRQGDNRTKS